VYYGAVSEIKKGNSGVGDLQDSADLQLRKRFVKKMDGLVEGCWQPCLSKS